VLASKIDELEKILGANLERPDARVIPGTDDAATRNSPNKSQLCENRLTT
jgi:hypothetical protein